MKKAHLVGIIIIAVAISVIIGTIADSSTYATFSEAAKYSGVEVHVIGQLNKEKEFIYNPEENANLFAFYMIDKDGEERKVLFNGTKPQDFERSEQIVLSGKISGDVFIASKILMKCPSKYNNGKVDVEVTAVSLSNS